MTQKNRTLEGKNRTLGGEGGSKIVKNCRTSFMYVPLSEKENIFLRLFNQFGKITPDIKVVTDLKALSGLFISP